MVHKSTHPKVNSEADEPTDIAHREHTQAKLHCILGIARSLGCLVSIVVKLPVRQETDRQAGKAAEAVVDELINRKVVGVQG